MTAIEQGQEPPAPKYKRVLMKILWGGRPTS